MKFYCSNLSSFNVEERIDDREGGKGEKHSWAVREEGK
jgi:hypothetical protein